MTQQRCLCDKQCVVINTHSLGSVSGPKPLTTASSPLASPMGSWNVALGAYRAYAAEMGLSWSGNELAVSSVPIDRRSESFFEQSGARGGRAAKGKCTQHPHKFNTSSTKAFSSGVGCLSVLPNKGTWNPAVSYAPVADIFRTCVLVLVVVLKRIGEVLGRRTVAGLSTFADWRTLDMGWVGVCVLDDVWAGLL